MPITATCRKQLAVSHSSGEAEIIALEELLRTEALPAVYFRKAIQDMYGKW